MQTERSAGKTMNAPHPSRLTPEAAKRQHIEDQLDRALADSFPASDPVAIVISQHEEAWDAESPTKSTS